MAYSENTTTTTTTTSGGSAAIVAAVKVQSSPTSVLSPTSPSSSPPPSPPVILSPCAACKILRRRCVEKCVLAPYFPPTDPLKFTIAHRVFGASNIIKLLQELPEAQRADAVNSMVYEANARLRDPVYGCAGAICQLQKQISDLQAEVARAQAEILNIQCQNANLFELICKQMAARSNDLDHDQDQEMINLLPQLPNIDNNSANFFFDESILGAAWEPLWT